MITKSHFYLEGDGLEISYSKVTHKPPSHTTEEHPTYRCTLLHVKYSSSLELFGSSRNQQPSAIDSLVRWELQAQFLVAPTPPHKHPPDEGGTRKVTSLKPSTLLSKWGCLEHLILSFRHYSFSLGQSVWPFLLRARSRFADLLHGKEKRVRKNSKQSTPQKDSKYEKSPLDLRRRK